MIFSIILVIWCFVLSFKVINLSDRLEDTISRNRVQHDNIEKELHYIHCKYLKLHLSSEYGKTVESINNYMEQDIQSLKEVYKSGQSHCNINSLRTGNKGVIIDDNSNT